MLQPVKLAPVRSTKPLTLPDDVELRTSKRLRHGDAEQAEHGQQVGAAPAGVHGPGCPACPCRRARWPACLAAATRPLPA